MTHLSTEKRVWTATGSKLPPEDVIVDTMISDIGGERNKQALYRKGRLWFVPDGTIYVYYTPTHWSEIVV
jgi:hypothetical protein